MEAIPGSSQVFDQLSTHNKGRKERQAFRQGSFGQQQGWAQGQGGPQGQGQGQVQGQTVPSQGPGSSQVQAGQPPDRRGPPAQGPGYGGGRGGYSGMCCIKLISLL